MGLFTGGDVRVVVILVSCCMDGEGLVYCRCFGGVLIWPFYVLMELGRNFWTASTVRPGQVAKKLLLVAFVREDKVGLNANRCRKSKSSVLFFCAYTEFAT